MKKDLLLQNQHEHHIFDYFNLLIFVGLAFRQPDLRSPYEEGAFHATHTGQQYYLWGEPWLNPGSNQQQMVYLNGIEIGISVKLLAFFRTDVDFMEMKHEVMLDPCSNPKLGCIFKSEYFLIFGYSLKISDFAKHGPSYLRMLLSTIGESKGRMWGSRHQIQSRNERIWMWHTCL